MSRALGGHSCGPRMPMILGVESLSPNHADILTVVDYVLDNARTIRVEDPREVVSEVTRNENGTFVHLLNWNEITPVAGLKVSLLAPADRKVTKVHLLSPDREMPAASLPFALNHGRVEFVVPSLVCYDVVVVE